MQGAHRIRSFPPEYIAAVARHEKSEPLVPRHLVREVHERITFDGHELVELDEDQARAQIGELLELGVEGFAVAFLWSVVNPSHERAVKSLIQEMAPGAFVSISSELAPRLGEYERTMAAVVNSLVGPVTAAYLHSLRDCLANAG